MGRRFIGGMLVVLGMAAGLEGQGKVIPPATRPAEEPKVPTATLEIVGRKIERPVLAYSLMYRAEEMAKGNSAVKYLIAGQWYDEQKKLTAEEWDEIDKLRNEPVSAFDEALAKRYLEDRSGPFRWVRAGAKLEGYDTETSVREEGLRALLPSLGKYRAIANLLVVAIRVDIKHHRWEEARDKLATGYGMARHLCQGETVIESLVGAAIANIMTKCLEDWAAEDGPNLYWELVNMPRPFADMGRAWSYERATADFSFPELKEMRAGKYSAGNWEALVNRFHEVSVITGGPTHFNVGGPWAPASVRQMTAAFYGTMEYPRAKAFLVARGMSREEVKKMPVAEALGRCFVRSYDETADEGFKALALPAYEVARFQDALEKELSDPTNEMNILARMLIPAMGKARVLAARVDRQIDMMRIAEGIRAYAGEKGKLPTTLEEMGLPAPLDVTKGKAFEYTSDGVTARLSSPGTDEKHVRGGAAIVLNLKKAR